MCSALRKYLCTFHVIILVVFVSLNASSAVLSAYTQQRYDAPELQWMKYNPMHMIMVVEVGKLIFSLVWLSFDIYLELTKVEANLEDSTRGDDNVVMVSITHAPLKASTATAPESAPLPSAAPPSVAGAPAHPSLTHDGEPQVAHGYSLTTMKTEEADASARVKAANSVSSANVWNRLRFSRSLKDEKELSVGEGRQRRALANRAFPSRLFWQRLQSELALCYFQPQAAEGLQGSPEQVVAEVVGKSVSHDKGDTFSRPHLEGSAPYAGISMGEQESSTLPADFSVDRGLASVGPPSSRLMEKLWPRAQRYINCEAFLMAVPAIAYAIQNLFILDSQAKLNPIAFQVTFQLRIFMTAVAMRVIMKTSISWRRWASLCLLFGGVVCAQMGGSKARNGVRPARLKGEDAGKQSTTSAVRAARAMTRVGGRNGNVGLSRASVAATALIRAGKTTAATAVTTADRLAVEALAVATATPTATTAAELAAAVGISTATASPTFVSGMTSLFIGCTISVLSAVYMEAVFKKRAKKAFLSTRNVHLAFFSILYFSILSVREYRRLRAPEDTSLHRSDAVNFGYRRADFDSFGEYLEHFLNGFDSLVWFMVLIKVANGLGIAIIMRYTDNIVKTMSTAAAIIVSGVWSYFLFDMTLTPMFMLGSTLVIVAIVLYNLWR